MLTISNPRKAGTGGGYYFNYYSRDSEQKPQWFGKGAEKLGLTGEVTKEALNNLLNGFSQDGKSKLVQNAGKDSRQRFWDCTFSVPKSVSTLFVLSPADEQKQIDAIIERRVKACLSEIELVAGFSRKGKGGEDLVSAGLVFALFKHVTSRTEDPQVHWHCLLINVGVCEDGTTGSLYTLPLFLEKMKAGARFQEGLATDLKLHFGLEIEKRPVGFHIKGVPQDLCDALSKRRLEIKQHLDRKGESGTVRAKVAAVETRGTKNHTKLSELSQIWKSAARGHSFGPDQVKELFAKALQQKEFSPQPPREDGKRQEPAQNAWRQDKARPEIRVNELAAGVDRWTAERSQDAGRMPSEGERRALFEQKLRNIPMKEAQRPFLVVGASGSGKTLMIHAMMKSLLPRLTGETDFRAFIYDDKPDFMPFARELKLSDYVWNFDPFDASGVAWDIAADVTTYAEAAQVAAILAPIDPGLHEPYFQQAVQGFLNAVLVSFLETCGKDWTLRDVALAFNGQRRLEQILSRHPESIRLARSFTSAYKSIGEVLASVRTKLGPYDIAAALWSHADEKRSVREWHKQNAILLVTGRSLFTRAVKPINQVLFGLASLLLLNEEDSTDRASWVFLDEIREIGILQDFHSLANKGAENRASLEEVSGPTGIWAHPLRKPEEPPR